MPSSFKITDDQRDRATRLDRIMHRMGRIDRTAVENPDPAHRYHWCYDNPRAVSQMKAEGFVVVPKAKREGDVRPAHGDWSDARGAYMLGDQILMYETMEVYENKRAADAARQKWMEGGSIDEIEETINRTARDGGVVGAHQAAFVKGREHGAGAPEALRVTGGASA